MPGDLGPLTSRPSCSELPSAAWVRIEGVLARFEDAWRQGQRPSLEEYLYEGGTEQSVLLVELVHEDLEYRLRAGEPVRVEDYFQRFPQLRTDERVALELIVAEYTLRSVGGDSATEYLERFP